MAAAGRVILVLGSVVGGEVALGESVQIPRAVASTPTAALLHDALRAFAVRLDAQLYAHTTLVGGLPGVLIDRGPDMMFYLLHARVRGNAWIMLQQHHLEAPLPPGLTLMVRLMPYPDVTVPGWAPTPTCETPWATCVSPLPPFTDLCF
jgi:hypothetical protein